MLGRIFRWIVVCAVPLATLTSSTKAQQPVLIEGKPALRFEAPVKNTAQPPRYEYLQRVDDQGDVAFTISVVSGHRSDSVGTLSISEKRVSFKPTATLSAWCLTRTSKPIHAEDAFDVALFELRAFSEIV